jgi:putative transposase
MKLRWTFRAYPTDEQEQHLARTFGCCRFVYNWALNQRTQAFKDGNRMNYAQSSAALTSLKRDSEHLWLNEVSSVPTQQALRHLQTAFTNFFEKRAGYPSFQKRQSAQSAEYTRSAFKFDLGNQRLELAKLGRLKVKWSRKIEVEPSTVTVIRRPSGRYFVSLVLDIQPAPLPETGQSVGIDFGVARLATLSTGETVHNPKYIRKYERKLASAQRKLSRKQKGSNRRNKARQRVARIHEKIAESRKDGLNKLAWKLVSENDSIFVEDLNLRGMVRNHSLARSLNDAAIGTAIRKIETKATMHGKTVVKIDRFFPSSKMCSTCGAIQEQMPLDVRHWTCDCGASHDRDENAAINILAVGQTVTAQGGGVRAARSSEREASRL